jgi:hypothetical protein
VTEPSGDLEARVAALEALIGVLAGGADRDVDQIRGEIRNFRQAATSRFNALREDLADLRTHVDTGFIEMRGKLDAAAAGEQQIVELLSTLIGRRGDDQPGG